MKTDMGSQIFLDFSHIKVSDKSCLQTLLKKFSKSGLLSGEMS